MCIISTELIDECLSFTDYGDNRETNVKKKKKKFFALLKKVLDIQFFKKAKSLIRLHVSTFLPEEM